MTEPAIEEDQRPFTIRGNGFQERLYQDDLPGRVQPVDMRHRMSCWSAL